MGLPVGPGAFGLRRRRHRFHTPGMHACGSLARSKIVLAHCTGYVVTDPNLQSTRSFQGMTDLMFNLETVVGSGCVE